ncbi:MAG: tyrosine-type recombinase/integrase, partial [Steroidobacteraceae bacterium]
MSERPAIRRLSRGTIELRGRTWWNRYGCEFLEVATGEVRRRQARLRLGRFRSAAEAARALDRYLALQGAEVLQPGVAVTFREYAARFDRLRVALMRPQSMRAYRSILKNHLEPSFGDRQLQVIDTPAVQEFVAALHAKGLSPATIGTTVNRLRQILAAARAEGYAAHVITRGAVRLPSDSRAARERRHITDGELQRILAASSGERRALWAVLGYSGARIGEALGLEWQHLDLASGWLRIRQAATCGVIAPCKTKTATRDIPLLPELHAALSAYKVECGGEPSGLLFHTSRGRPRRGDDVRRRWLQPTLERLGIPPA